jgi:hypothetical protein
MTPRSAARRVVLAVAMLGAMIGCGGRQFLGAPLPASCTRSQVDCAAELLQRAWRDTVGVDDPALRAYVRGIIARLVRGSTLREPPDVALGWSPEVKVVGGRIQIGVGVIVRFDSEAELAGVLAHEIAHLEARGDASWRVPEKLDEESVADERAVTLLARAGYPPAAFATGLARLPGTDEGDPDHLPIAERIQRARVLAAQLPTGGDDRRAALLAAIDGRAIESTTMAFIGGDAIEATYLTFYDAGPRDADHHLLDPDRMIVVLPDRDIALGTPNLGAPGPTGTWNVWPVGRAGAATIAAALADPHRRDLAVGTATLGRSPRAAGTALDHAIRTAIDEIAPLGTELAVAVIATPAGGVVVTFDGPDGAVMLERWLARFRRPTAAERTRAVHRIQLAVATRTAPLRELVASCPEPAFAAAADSGARTVRAGERFKCAVR